MKITIAFIILCLTFELSFSQLQIGVTTNKLKYTYGDTINISVIVTNLSSDTMRLVFGSSCQANYYIDDFNFYYHTACLAVLSGIILAPNQSDTSYFEYPRYQSMFAPLSVGQHKVVGEILNYGKSDTLVIEVVSSTVGVKNNLDPPPSFRLEQNYPNPFNPTTSISFGLPFSCRVRLSITNILGETVQTSIDQDFSAGNHIVRINFNGLASGIYFYKIDAGSYHESKKLILLK